MTTQTTTLTDFLLARITEDEAAAREALGEPAYAHFGDTPAEETLEMALSEGCAPEGARHFRRWMPTHVLAECEAKRRIVEDFEILHRDYRETHDPTTEARRFQARVAMARVAAIYADHPDYRENEWRP